MFESPFLAYAYSYPHKTAYRPLSPAVPLSDVWSNQDQRALFLYLHVPFCEYRCGFCNLFTLSQPESSLPAKYLRAMRRQASSVRAAIPDASFARLAIGGGTPTFLSTDEMEQLFAIIADTMGVDTNAIPGACEASPSTITEEKLTLLRENGINRLSLGIQSFDPRESGAMGRPQKACDVERALTLIGDAQFSTVNLDLIYGGQRQTVNSWLRSVQQAIEFGPDEIYLYPLYVRELTGLGRSGRYEISDSIGQPSCDWDDQRLTAYREARHRLLESGYRQVSFRMFQRDSDTNVEGPVYCCQTDAMVGLGCGARSYTDILHYSYEYAVQSGTIDSILADYVQRDENAFTKAEFGFWLDEEDRRRRFLVMSLLQCDGMQRRDYEEQFGTCVLDDFPSLQDLLRAGYLLISDSRLLLTETGIEYSDAIGPWLNSIKVQQLEDSYQCR